MAICPQCDGEIARLASECPHCGYDFPLTDAPKKPTIFYSKFATVSLFIGMVCSALGWIAALMRAVQSLVEFDLWMLIQSMIGFFVLFALFVLFGRAVEWADRPSE